MNERVAELRERAERLATVVGDIKFPQKNSEVVDLSQQAAVLRDLLQGPPPDADYAGRKSSPWTPGYDALTAEPLISQLDDALARAWDAVSRDPENAPVRAFEEELSAIFEEALVRTSQDSANPDERRSAQARLEDMRKGRTHRELMAEVNRAAIARRAIEVSAREAAEAADASERAAGRSADGALDAHFSKFAKDETKTADILRGVGIALVAVVVATLLWLQIPSDASAVDFAQRLTIAIPGFALAAYLLREAGRHRAAAQWADTAQVQLRTVAAYTSGLPESAAVEVRTMLARRVFGDGPIAKEADPTLTTTDILDRVVALLRQAR